MAFRKLPKSAFGGKSGTHPTVAIYKNNTVFTIPSTLLDRAGVSDKPGKKVTLLIGEGEDAGLIAVTNGDDFTLISSSGSLNTLRCNSGRIGKSPHYKSKHLEYEINEGALILTMPSDFPWKDAVKPRVVAPVAPPRRVLNTIGAAA